MSPDRRCPTNRDADTAAEAAHHALSPQGVAAAEPSRAD